MNIRLESYFISTEPVKRMKVRTHGKRTSKVKTDLKVLRKAEQMYSCGLPSELVSNRHLYNKFQTEEYDKEIGFEKVKFTTVVRGQAVRFKEEALLQADAMDNTNGFLKEILKFKRITHADVYKAYMAFEEKRGKQLERIYRLLATPKISPEKVLVLKKLKLKWKTCKAHCRYIVRTDITYDFDGTNLANDIRSRGMKLGVITINKVFEDGGIMFDQGLCQRVSSWREINLSQISI